MTATGATQRGKKETTKVARYVRIELPGAKRTLSLAEVQVVRDGRNIAPNGVASQSGTSNGGLPGRAIDGNTSGVFNQGSVTHTPVRKDPWWELDLSKPQGVQQITIWNRTDCCAERLDNFTLKLLDNRRKVIYERKGLRGPRDRTDYLMTGESVVVGVTIEDVGVTVERRQKLQPAINTAIARGSRYLMDMQLRDGSWAGHTPAYRAGQTALAVYTLVKCGVSRTDPAVRMGLRYLQEYPPLKTYSVGITMMLYETLSDEDLKEDMKDMLDRLVETQIKGRTGNGGLWGYPNGCDLSNTQYAALGLLAAHRAGLKVPSDVFKRLLSGTLRNQETPQIVAVQRKEGETSTGEIRMAGFSYRIGDKKCTGSMTTAGLAIVAICKKGLEKKVPAKTLAEASASLRMGLEWLDRHFSVDTNPLKGGRHLYYLYGLERVGALLAVDYIGGKHWYWEGSDVLVRKQGGNGAWSNNEHDSCFALLFLSKATSKGSLTGPMQKKREDVRVSDGPNVQIQWRATGTNPVTMWITGFNEKLIKQYSDPKSLVKGLRITGVEYLCDGKLIERVASDPGKGWEGARFAIRHGFKGTGKYQMTVRLRLVNPKAQVGQSGETTVLSKPLKVFVRDEFTVNTIEATSGRKRKNLFRESRVERKASSQFHKNNDITKAFDGLQSTQWLSAKADKQPILSFRFSNPVRANTLVLSDANTSIMNAGTYDRSTRIEVVINNQRNPQYVDITKSVLDSWIFKFRTVRLRTIQIRILERKKGKAKAGVVGFSEIELLYDK